VQAQVRAQVSIIEPTNFPLNCIAQPLRRTSPNALRPVHASAQLCRKRRLGVVAAYVAAQALLLRLAVVSYLLAAKDKARCLTRGAPLGRLTRRDLNCPLTSSHVILHWRAAQCTPLCASARMLQLIVFVRRRLRTGREADEVPRLRGPWPLANWPQAAPSSRACRRHTSSEGDAGAGIFCLRDVGRFANLSGPFVHRHPIQIDMYERIRGPAANSSAWACASN
jgi:hypothetical protein